MEAVSNKDRLNGMFRELRRQRIVARQNFMCCGSCASAELASMVRERDARGAVYYHRQEGERLRAGAERVYLAYGAGDGASESEDRVIGLEIVHAAQRNGLAVDWDGDVTKCVVVLLPGGVGA